jgi:hypothetical protein
LYGDHRNLEEKSFKEVKDSYRGDYILILRDPRKQSFRVRHSDASDYAVSEEISQLDDNEKRRPVLLLFFSTFQES